MWENSTQMNSGSIISSVTGSLGRFWLIQTRTAATADAVMNRILMARRAFPSRILIWSFMRPCNVYELRTKIRK